MKKKNIQKILLAFSFVPFKVFAMESFQNVGDNFAGNFTNDSMDKAKDFQGVDDNLSSTSTDAGTDVGEGDLSNNEDIVDNGADNMSDDNYSNVQGTGDDSSTGKVLEENSMESNNLLNMKSYLEVKTKEILQNFNQKGDDTNSLNVEDMKNLEDIFKTIIAIDRLDNQDLKNQAVQKINDSQELGTALSNQADVDVINKTLTRALSS